MPASTILLLESDPEAGQTLSAILTTAGYTVTLSDDPEEAFPKVVEHQLVVVDLIGGPKSAVDVCREKHSL